jgi:hypothetical protein
LELIQKNKGQDEWIGKLIVLAVLVVFIASSMPVIRLFIKALKEETSVKSCKHFF